MASSLAHQGIDVVLSADTSGLGTDIHSELPRRQRTVIGMTLSVMTTCVHGRG
jgi:hypothetical protein